MAYLGAVVARLGKLCTNIGYTGTHLVELFDNLAVYSSEGGRNCPLYPRSVDSGRGGTWCGSVYLDDVGGVLIDPLFGDA